VKILLDQNISFRVIRLISSTYSEAKQVRELSLENVNDLGIWQYAKQNGYCIVTFDADFYDMANLYGHPPKIIWLRTGNTKTTHIAKLLLDKQLIIKTFIQDPAYNHLACLEID
jgi:predicted nuclease of predicted toxin-antitoxin system